MAKRKSVLDKARRSANLISERQHTGPGLPSRNGDEPKPAATPGEPKEEEVKSVAESVEETQVLEVALSVGEEDVFTEVDGIAIPGRKHYSRRSASLAIVTHEKLKAMLGPRGGMGKMMGELLEESLVAKYDKKVGKKLAQNNPEAFKAFFKDDPGLSHVVMRARMDRMNRVHHDIVQLALLVTPPVFEAFRQFCHDLKCPQYFVLEYLLDQYLEKRKKRQS